MAGFARALALAAGAVTLGAPLVASATVIVPRTIEEMSRDANRVVHGRVVSSQASWDEQHQRIFTLTEIEVLDQIHGPTDAPKRVTVRTLGGEVGKVGMKVAGTEKFAPNEEVLVFLRRDPVVTNAFQVVGMSQGKYSIEQDASGKRVAVPSTEGLAFVKRDNDTGVYKVDENGTHPGRLPLDDLKKRISDAVHNRPDVQVPESTIRLKPAQTPAKP